MSISFSPYFCSLTFFSLPEQSAASEFNSQDEDTSHETSASKEWSDRENESSQSVLDSAHEESESAEEHSLSQESQTLEGASNISSIDDQNAFAVSARQPLSSPVATKAPKRRRVERKKTLQPQVGARDTITTTKVGNFLDKILMTFTWANEKKIIDEGVESEKSAFRLPYVPYSHHTLLRPLLFFCLSYRFRNLNDLKDLFDELFQKKTGAKDSISEEFLLNFCARCNMNGRTVMFFTKVPPLP